MFSEFTQVMARLDAELTEAHREDVPEDFMGLVDHFAAFIRAQKTLREQADRLTPRLEELRAKLIEAHPSSGLGKSFKIATGGQVIFKEQTKAVATDKVKMVKWFLENKMQAMLGVNAQTLTSFCKDEMKENRPLPTGVEVGSYKQVTFRKK